MVTWEERLAWMRLVADRFPHPTGRPIGMYRRGKRGLGRLRPAKTLEMCVAANEAVREGEQALVDRDSRRSLAPHQVYEMRIRVLGLERDEALAAEYGVVQSSATRAIDGDTYRNVPFPIRISHPDVPVELYYPYPDAVAILASAPIDQAFHITIRPHIPRLRIPGMLRLLDERFPDSAARRPATRTPPRRDASIHTDSYLPVGEWLGVAAPVKPASPTRPIDAETRRRRAQRRRRSG